MLIDHKTIALRIFFLSGFRISISLSGYRKYLNVIEERLISILKNKIED